MFTGIIQAVGEVAAIEQTGGDVKLRIKTGDLPLEDVRLGDSIATNGVCLTVTELPGDGYWADVSTETLSLTSLKSTVVGSAVNLEKSLTPTTALGGHLVSGHVDGLGRVVGLTRDARSWRVSIEAPSDLARYIAQKGSICVDGTSLTVNSVADHAQGCEISINLIPHTVQNTALHRLSAGAKVNLEIDLIARYVERMLRADPSLAPPQP